LHFKRTKVIKIGQGDHVDLADFSRQINPGEQVVLVLTAGTTMTSAYDPVDECTAILKQKGCEFYLHMDAALGGLVVPFQQEDLGQLAPACTFANPDVVSMTISAHKILGTPMPANIYLCRQDIIQRFKKQVKNIPYLSDIKDISLYSSRDGFRVLAVMARLQQFDAEQIQRLVRQCLETADYLIAGLHAQGMTSVFRNSFGMAVVFPLDTFVATFSAEAQSELFQKYHLVKNQQYAHLYTMGHVTKAVCDEFIEDCRRLKNPV
jgi:histidine decarboxylase